ncbi:hypothetical protein [Lentzea terrae]|uniref:hypothetical protein n=1 Tax=Lentzea terrae TaxID=2200761 RepID=UPI001300310A|nr:hypothetical protein [Lentzea terrae]
MSRNIAFRSGIFAAVEAIAVAPVPAPPATIEVAPRLPSSFAAPSTSRSYRFLFSRRRKVRIS